MVESCSILRRGISQRRGPVSLRAMFCRKEGRSQQLKRHRPCAPLPGDSSTGTSPPLKQPAQGCPSRTTGSPLTPAGVPGWTLRSTGATGASAAGPRGSSGAKKESQPSLPPRRSCLLRLSSAAPRSSSSPAAARLGLARASPHAPSSASARPRTTRPRTPRPPDIKGSLRREASRG